jgi:tetratricopeptide (TPR) repeat protein
VLERNHRRRVCLYREFHANGPIARFIGHARHGGADASVLRPRESIEPQSRRLAGANAPETGKGRKVRDCFQLALRMNPNYADAHYNLGLLFETLGKKSEAFFHLRTARKIYLGK